MFKTTKFLLFTVFISFSITAQNTEHLIQDIKAQYNYILTNLDSFNTTTVDVWDESTEGGTATAFYEEDKLMLIKVVLLGESGKTMAIYYFNNEKLIFVLTQDFKYNRPIYWTKEHAKEILNDEDVYDPEKSKVEENRYYFNNNNLFLWLDVNNNEMDLTNSKNSVVGEVIQNRCKSLIKNLKQ